MNYDYIITENGELYHWKKKDAKYIDRKWSKGKWVYTYPSDTKGKNSGSSGNTTKKTAANVSKEYLAELEYNSKKNEYPQKSTSKKTSRSSNATTKPASTTTSKSSNNVSKEYLAELEYNSKKNEYPKQTTSTNTSTKKAETPKKTETSKKKSGDGFKKLVDKAKDWLGFNEKEKYESAKEQEKIAKSQEAVAKKKYENDFETSKEQNVKSSKAWGKASSAAKNSGDELDIDKIRTAANENKKADRLFDIALDSSYKSTAAKKKREIAEGNTKSKYEEFLKTPIGFFSNPGESTKLLIKEGKAKAEEFFNGYKKSRVPDPVITPPGSENVIKENTIKEKPIKEKKIEEKKIEEKMVVDTTITRKKADKAYETIKSEYEAATKTEKELYDKAKSLQKSSDTKAFEKAKNEFDEAFKKSLKLRDRKDACYQAKQDLEDKLDEIEHDLSVIQSLTPTEETRQKEREYHQQIEDAIDEYYRIINGT